MKAKLGKFSAIIVILITATGCTQEVKKEPLFIWGDYQYTSTAYGKHNEDLEVVERHTQELEKIINESKINDRKVAPGIYAEYAEILYKSGKKSDAKAFFLLEKSIYPESSKFMNQVVYRLYGNTK